VDLSALRKRVSAIQKARDLLERQLIATRAHMEVGSVYEMYTSCHKGNCKCTVVKNMGHFSI